MRIALFGGTFDPPHRGHTAIARAAANAFALDRVLFAPTGLQPLKPEGATSPYEVRLALAAAGCQEDTRFAVSEIDAPHFDGSPNYTVDTLAALTVLFPSDTIFNLVGADSFLSLRHWRSPERLLQLAEWIVVSRPGYGLTEEYLVPLGLSQSQRSRVHLLSGVDEDISATDLRERLHRGEDCGDLLPAAVAAYIRLHQLYRGE
jgi:nicotinate-nucleotide adenylyltransferase